MPDEMLLKHIRETYEYCHRNNKKHQQVPRKLQMDLILDSFGEQGGDTSLWASRPPTQPTEM